jgi:hypothetical protein
MAKVRLEVAGISCDGLRGCTFGARRTYRDHMVRVYTFTCKTTQEVAYDETQHVGLRPVRIGAGGTGGNHAADTGGWTCQRSIRCRQTFIKETRFKMKRSKILVGLLLILAATVTFGVVHGTQSLEPNSAPVGGGRPS